MFVHVLMPLVVHVLMPLVVHVLMPAPVRNSCGKSRHGSGGPTSRGYMPT